MTVPLRSADIPRFERGGLELAARAGVDGLYAGRHRSRRLGSSLDFADHRAYQEGDDPSDIDWKAYARTDRLLIRRWHDDRQLPIALLVDTSASMDYGEPPKGRTARLAAAIIGLLALDQGDRLRLLLSGSPHSHRPVRGEELCAWLAGTDDGGDLSAAVLLRRSVATLAERHLLVVISDLLDDPAELLDATAGAIARRHGVAALQVLDASELELPVDWGPSRLADPEGRAPAVDGEAAELAARYATAFAAHQERLTTGLASLGAEHALLTGTAPLIDRIAAWLARRGGR